MNPKKLRKFGWICFGLMWIPFTTLMIGVLQLPPGEYGLNEMPALAMYSLIPLSVLFILTFALIFGSLFASSIQNARIRKNGKPGRAKIVELYETGTTINHQPVVGFQLEVRSEYGELFQATTEQLISRFSITQYQPGAEVEVKYDPDTKRVVIV
ncbi:MAG: hypothetical protein JJU37_12500 [Balneolaceae bacterium]|nr:hypothetical protein [Balneolaceae bacterium]